MDPHGPPLPALPRRDPRGHKGTFGTVVVIGGCAGPGARMVGAPALTARAALRAGAGLCRLVMPAPILNAAIGICPSATGAPIGVDTEGAILPHEAAAAVDAHLAGAGCIVVGPGLGGGDGLRAAVLRTLQQEEAPVVVDADAINLLAGIPELWRDLRAAAVLTPHPGEYGRLASALNIGHDPADPGDRPAAAEALAQRLGCIVVLKGAGTIVTDGQRTWLNTTGGSELATAGTGDVLSGVIAGLVAQFVGPPRPAPMPRPPGKPLDLFDAARLAVHAHGLAGERWAVRHRASGGLLAAELADELPAVLAGLAGA